MENDFKTLFFQDKPIRCLWYNEEWYFSVLDFINIFINNSPAPEKYWRVLKKWIELGKRHDGFFPHYINLELITIKRKDYTNKKGLHLFIENLPFDNKEVLKLWLQTSS
jgi:DNA-damage-inducible protein D